MLKLVSHASQNCCNSQLRRKGDGCLKLCPNFRPFNLLHNLGEGAVKYLSEFLATLLALVLRDEWTKLQ